MYLKSDLKSTSLNDFGCKFDVILIEPPLEEYQRSLGVTNVDFWTWDQVLCALSGSTINILIISDLNLCR